MLIDPCDVYSNFVASLVLRSQDQPLKLLTLPSTVLYHNKRPDSNTHSNMLHFNKST